MAVTFSILSFMPLYISSTTNGFAVGVTGNDDSTNTTMSVGDDDYTYLDLEHYGHSPYLRQAAMACLIICVIPGVDTLVDITPSFITKALFLEEKRLPNYHNNAANMIRLTLPERVMFITGILCLSVLCVCPSWTRGNTEISSGGDFRTATPS